MNIGQKYTHIPSGTSFTVDNIKVQLNFDGIMETIATLRLRGGTTSDVVVTADFLSKLVQM